MYVGKATARRDRVRRPGGAGKRRGCCEWLARLRFPGAPRRVLRSGRDLHRGGAAVAGRPRGRRTRPPHGSVPEVIAAVERGDADGGVVPIENMIEGSVSVTLDTLAFDSELLIQREIDLPVSLNLCAPPGRGARPTSARSSRSRTRSRSAGAGSRKKLPGGRDPGLALHLRRGPRGVALEAPRPRRDLQRPGRRPLRPRGARHRHRGPPRERDPLRARRARASRRRPVTTRRRSSASSARTGRVRCSASSRSSRRATSTSPSSSRGRPSAASATTASSSTAKVTSPTRWSPTRCATSRRSRRGEVPRFVSGRRSGRSGRRAPPARSARRGSTRRRGSTTLRAQIRETTQ